MLFYINTEPLSIPKKQTVSFLHLTPAKKVSFFTSRTSKKGHLSVPFYILLLSVDSRTCEAFSRRPPLRADSFSGKKNEPHFCLAKKVSFFTSYTSKKGNCEQKVSVQLIISPINIITGISKMNDGDKNKPTLRTLKNNSRVYSKCVPCVNANTTISQNAKNPIIVMIVKMTVFTFVRSKHSITR